MENLFIPKYLNRDVLLTVTLPRLCIPQYFCRLLFLRGHSSIISKTLPVLHFSKTNSQNRLFCIFSVSYSHKLFRHKTLPPWKVGVTHRHRILILSEFFSCQWWMSINSTHWALYRVNLFTIVCLLMSHLSTGT